jgi:hypothetical protein
MDSGVSINVSVLFNFVDSLSDFCAICARARGVGSIKRLGGGHWLLGALLDVEKGTKKFSPEMYVGDTGGIFPSYHAEIARS